MALASERLSVGILAKPTNDQIRAARIAVAGRAIDADDCRELLAMLGLTPHPDNTTASE